MLRQLAVSATGKTIASGIKNEFADFYKKKDELPNDYARYLVNSKVREFLSDFFGGESKRPASPFQLPLQSSSKIPRLEAPIPTVEVDQAGIF